MSDARPRNTRSGLLRVNDPAERHAYEEDLNETLERRAMGMSFRQIAESMGVSASTARDRYNRALEAARPHEAIEEIRVNQAAEAKIARRNLWQVALSKDATVTTQEKLAAFGHLARLWDHEARLFGVYEMNVVEAAERRDEFMTENAAEVTQFMKAVLQELGVPLNADTSKVVRRQISLLIETETAPVAAG